MEHNVNIYGAEQFDLIATCQKNYYIIPVDHRVEVNVGDTVCFVEREWGHIGNPTGRKIVRTISYIGHDVEVYPRQIILSFKETVAGFWMDKPENGNKVQMENGIPVRQCWCSNCKAWLDLSDEYPVTGYYCPTCGAKMEE